MHSEKHTFVVIVIVIVAKMKVLLLLGFISLFAKGLTDSDYTAFIENSTYLARLNF